MNVSDVPQEGNVTLGNHRKALYAKDAQGRMVLVASRGSEVDETVTLQAVERMQAEAEANAEADKKRKEQVEAKNVLDSLIYTAEKTLNDAGEKAKAEDKTALEAAIAEAKTKQESIDTEELKKAGETLSEAMQKVGATKNKQAAPAEGAPEGEAKPDEPVEGEVVEEKPEETK